MDFASNIEVKKEEISSEIDCYEYVQNDHMKINNNDPNQTNYFQQIKSEHEIELESSDLKDYTFEECRVCRSVFPNKYCLLQHHLSHLIIPLPRLDLYQCQYCLLLYTKKIELDQHMSIEHKDKNNKQKNTLNKQGFKTRRNHECGTCNKVYTYQHWHEHMRTVHGNVKLTCDQCDRSFKCQKYLYKHIKNMHLDRVRLKKVTEFHCEQCPKAFTSADCLNKHVKNCHGQKVRCQICDSVLKSVVYLNSHMRRVHCDSSKKAICRICGKQMKSERQVRIHIKNMHKKKLCPQCGQMFASMYHHHVKNCIIDNTKQNVGKDKIGYDDVIVDIDDNDHRFDDSQVNRNSNNHVNVNDQLNIIIEDNFKRETFQAAEEVKKNPIYHDDIDNVDVDDSVFKIEDLSDQANGNNLSFNGTAEKGNIKERNMKSGSEQEVNKYHINGDSNDQIHKGDANGHFCKVCSKQLKSEERVKIHMKNSHSKRLPLKCYHCGKFYFNLKYFSVHTKKCKTKKGDANQIKIEHTFELDEWAFKAL